MTQRTPSSAPSGRMTLSQMPAVPSYKDVADSALVEYCKTYGMSVTNPTPFHARR